MSSPNQFIDSGESGISNGSATLQSRESTIDFTCFELGKVFGYFANTMHSKGILGNTDKYQK
jgi:hypothetical protein